MLTLAYYTFAICAIASLIIWIADGPLARWDARRRRTRIEARRRHRRLMQQWTGNGRLPADHDHTNTSS